MVDHLIDKQEENYECPICYSLMLKIYEYNKCGHIFCKKCIKKITECPICKNKNIKYHHSKYLQRKLYNQKFRCYFENCDTIVTLSEAEKHIGDKHGIFNNIYDEIYDNMDEVYDDNLDEVYDDNLDEIYDENLDEIYDSEQMDEIYDQINNKKNISTLEFIQIILIEIILMLIIIDIYKSFMN